MLYSEQLATTQWQSLRQRILVRDNYKCTICGREAPEFKLDKKFGIKSFAEFSAISENTGFLPLRDRLLYFRGNYVDGIDFIDTIDLCSLQLPQLKFARLWQQEDAAEDSHYNYICFTNRITELDFIPDLNVHHKHYIKGKMAWEYSDNVLVTLCPTCHKSEHENNTILVYSDEKLMESEPTEICQRCEGLGYLPQYSHVENGICFSCGGAGVLLL